MRKIVQHSLRLGLHFVPLLALIQCAQPLPVDDATGSNHPPVIRSLTVTPPAVLIGAWVVIRVEAEDPDNDRLSYRWSANAGDVIGEGLEVRYTASYCCVGINVVRVRVEDGRGGITTRTLDIPVVQ
ncbi:MAG: hypothetical protein WEE20_13770 [Bacteroidota bacterium]